jgi:diguanylate cyclase (GGDEF)-like protein
MGTGRVSRGELLRRRRFPFSLQTRIVLVVLVCVVVPLLLMGAYLLEQTETALLQRATGTVSSRLDRRVTALDGWVEERIGEAQSWAKSFVVYENIVLLRSGGDRERLIREMAQYLELVLKDNQANYESILIVDTHGTALASTERERLDLQLEPWALEFLGQGQRNGTPGLVSGLRQSVRFNRPTMLVIHEIRDEKGPARDPRNEVIGYVVARLKVNALAQLLTKTMDDEPDFWLLDSRGGILVGMNSVAVELGAKPFPGNLPGVRDPNDQDAKGQDAIEADLPELGPTVYKVRPLASSLGGYLAATISSQGAYKPLVESRARLLKAGVPAILVIFALAFFLARGMLRPILLLSEGAQRVSAGDLDVHLPVRGRDELADLTSAFNDMARRVRESRDDLAQAAAALTRTNDQLEQAKERFRAQAITDGLTGLFNRRHFEDSLDEQIERASSESWPLSLLLLDLDHFKQYNDRWGHTEGDAELRRVGALVQRTVRSTDIAFRYGGEELAVLLPSCSKEQAVGVAEKVRVAVGSGTQRPSRFGARTTVSVGVATFPEDGRVARGLVDTADAALYQAKAQGRDRVVAAGGPSGGDPNAGERAAG